MTSSVYGRSRLLVRVAANATPTCCSADTERACSREQAYPADEAATQATLFFVGGFIGEQREFVGYVRGVCSGVTHRRESTLLTIVDVNVCVRQVCGTLTAGSSLTHDTMFKHNPAGTLLCIHSVVIDHRFRRRGLATAMLRQYLEHIRTNQPAVRQVRLLCKPHTKELYERCGFTSLGPSSVVHGADTWFELVLQLDR